MQERTREIIDQRQLVSVMNRTKWEKLGSLIESFEELEPEVDYESFWYETTRGFSIIHWDQFSAISESVVWLDIKTYKSKYIGALVKDRITDIRTQLLEKLKQASIPYSLEGENVRVWGYISPGQNINFV